MSKILSDMNCAMAYNTNIDASFQLLPVFKQMELKLISKIPELKTEYGDDVILSFSLRVTARSIK